MEKHIHEVILLEDNPRQMSYFMEGKTIESLLVFPKMLSVRPIILNKAGVVIGGNQRVSMLRKIAEMSAEEMKAKLLNQKKYRLMSEEDKDSLLSYWEQWKTNPVVPIRLADTFTPEEEREFVIKDNLHYGIDDMDKLEENFDLELVADYTGDDRYFTANEIYNVKDETSKETKNQNVVFSVGCIACPLTENEFNALEADIRLYIQRMDSPDGYITYLLKSL